MAKTRHDQENLLVVTLSCLLAIIGVMMMRMTLKLDYQTWSLVYLAAALTSAVRWTSAGATVSIGSIFRAILCFMTGLGAIKLSGYPATSPYQTASLVPPEVMEALARFHIFFN